jgi:hypothetical protein
MEMKSLIYFSGIYQAYSKGKYMRDNLITTSGLLKQKIFAVVLYGLLQVTTIGLASADVIWLSDTAPPKRTATTVPAQTEDAENEHHHDMAQMKNVPTQSTVAPAQSGIASAVKHDHAGGTEVDVNGDVVENSYGGNKRIWLRYGNDPVNSAYGGTGRDSETLTLFSQTGPMQDAVMKNENGLLSAKYEFPEYGFYNAYLTQSMDHGDMLHVQIAKAELLHGTCCAKGIDYEALAKPIINNKVPLELMREHYPDEGLFTRIVSGDKLSFIALSYGKPVAGATVSMTTQDGWSNSKVSNAEGRVSFTLIRDYFPAWLEFKKYHKQNYLMVADLDVRGKIVSDGAEYNSAHYTSSLPGNYYPSPNDYRSWAWGLGLSLFVIVFGGLSIYLYRRRRLKPFKEERVDDKA